MKWKSCILINFYYLNMIFIIRYDLKWDINMYDIIFRLKEMIGIKFKKQSLYLLKTKPGYLEILIFFIIFF